MFNLDGISFRIPMRVRHSLSRVCRMWQSRGFGIQSPWAYSFLHDVIRERLPYYAYEFIDRCYADNRLRRRQRLYHRLRNYCHASSLDIVDASQLSFGRVISAISSSHDGGIVVVEGIRDDAERYRCWCRLRDDEAVGVTFDLYDIAICFARGALYKQHYRVNY